MSKGQPKIFYLVTLAESGGAQKYIFDLATYFSQTNYQVIVAAGGHQNGPLFNKLRRLNIQTYHLKNLQRDINFYQDWLAFLGLIKLLRQIKPDIIHLNSSKAGVIGALAAKCCKIKKIIYTVHGLVLNEPLPPAKKAFYWIAEWLSAKFQTHLICVSEFDKKSVLKHKIAGAKKITVIHNGLELKNLKFLAKDEAREKLDFLIKHKLQITGCKLETAKTLIGSIANFYPTKGLIYLIEAAKQIQPIIPGLKIIIIGDGPDRRKLTQLIKNYKLENNIFLLGIIEQAYQYLKAFDIFVLPSIKEGLSYTLIEAKSAGLPVITTNVGGNPEIVEKNKTGILVPAKDSNALAENIINLIQNKKLQAQFTQNNIIKAKSFDIAQMLNKTAILYNS